MGEGPEGQNRTGGTPVQAHLLICSTQPRGAAFAQLGALRRDRAAAENVRGGEDMKESVNNYMLTLNMCRHCSVTVHSANHHCSYTVS